MNANFQQSNAPRSVALIAAVVMTVSLFQFVASLAAPSAQDSAPVVYAQAPVSVPAVR